MKHWLIFLPEVGRPIERLADGLMLQAERIQRMEAELKIAYAKYNEDEARAERIVAADWTDEEIKSAKIRSSEQ